MKAELGPQNLVVPHRRVAAPGRCLVLPSDSDWGSSWEEER